MDEDPKTSSDAPAARPRERRVLLPGGDDAGETDAPVREAANQRLRDPRTGRCRAAGTGRRRTRRRPCQ
ncbi:hypothetical protein, partial [Streptomyces sp. LamerLS-31b]|uniref:hypothetical protein n=1 Tax=Streptomyces sp. LamerLS-31b TaxID=1839765 RepID=UPI00195FC5ED